MLEFFEKLKIAVLNEDLYETEEVINKILKTDSAFGYVKPILELMEENPNLDYGFPGPLVHFVEMFYKKGYEEILYQSVNQRPTPHTIWMMHRIINDPNLQNKEQYTELLKDILCRKDVNDSIKLELKNLLS